MASLAWARRGALALTAVILLGTAASCTATANVSDVYTALDSDGARQRNIFFTDSKEIHCVAEAGIGRKGVTIESLIRQLQSYDFIADRFFDTDRVLANAEASPSPGDGIQKFDVKLTPVGPDGVPADGAPFPPGRYVCEVYLDGAITRHALFNIEFPDCPTSTILPTSICYGFYKKGLSCPKYGATSRDPAQCRCSVKNGWECDP
jgi:hypothetical protein